MIKIILKLINTKAKILLKFDLGPKAKSKLEPRYNDSKCIIMDAMHGDRTNIHGQ